MRPAFLCVPAFAAASALPELSRALGLPTQALFSGHDPHGRPRAEAGGVPVPVSLAHCGAVWAVAMGASGRVGVDLVDPRAAIATSSMLDLTSPGERTWLEPLPEAVKRRRLFQIWACREALLKALGLGLTLDPGAVELAPCGDDGLEPARVLGCGTPPEGWHVEVLDGTAQAEGLILGLAWAD